MQLVQMSPEEVQEAPIELQSLSVFRIRDEFLDGDLDLILREDRRSLRAMTADVDGARLDLTRFNGHRV